MAHSPTVYSIPQLLTDPMGEYLFVLNLTTTSWTYFWTGIVKR